MNESILKLIKQIEHAPDFKYDDLAVKLTNELNKIGKVWKWSNDFYNPKVIIS